MEQLQTLLTAYIGKDVFVKHSDFLNSARRGSSYVRRAKEICPGGHIRRRRWPVLSAAIMALQAPAVFANWTTAGTVTYVEADNLGGFLMQTSSPVSSNCTTSGGAIYIQVGQNSVSTDGAKALLTTALAALMSGKTVQVMYDDTGPTCYGKYIQINQ